MATSFPSSLDSFTNPLSSDTLSSPSHSAQHADANDAIEALQAKVGADSSAVTSSLDYKVAQLEAISHGKILQVVHTHKNSVFSTTSTSYVDVTGLSATITPTSATSTVLVIVSLTVGGDNDGARGDIQLVRDSTPIGQSDSYSYYATGLWSRSDRWAYTALGSTNIHFMDSPATTSATTYKIQIREDGGITSTIYVNRAKDNDLYRGPSSITLFEVSA